MDIYILPLDQNIEYGLYFSSADQFLIYGDSSVPIEHQSLRQCHVVWRTNEGDCTVVCTSLVLLTFTDTYKMTL